MKFGNWYLKPEQSYITVIYEFPERLLLNFMVDWNNKREVNCVYERQVSVCVCVCVCVCMCEGGMHEYSAISVVCACACLI
jgi:hypothetical protein